MRNKAYVFNKSRSVKLYGRSNGSSLVSGLIIVLGIAILLTGWNYLVDVSPPVRTLLNNSEISLSINSDGKGKSFTFWPVKNQNYRKIKGENNLRYKTKNFNNHSNSELGQSISLTIRKRSGHLVRTFSSIDKYSTSATKYISDKHNLIGDEDNSELPYGKLSISGQVLDEQGNPVSNLEVIARVSYLFDLEIQINAIKALQKRQFTNRSGGFEFQDLANGEYILSTTSTEKYTSDNKLVRAGHDAIKLNVVRSYKVRVYGWVMDTNEIPLPGVGINLTGLKEPIYSDEYGNFSFYMTVRNDRAYSLMFNAEGYSDRKLLLSLKDWYQQYNVERSVVMEPARALATVSGIVRSKKGEPVQGEQIYLQSTEKKYKATTDGQGLFKHENVEVGGNYALLLIPKGPYKKYRKSNLQVALNGISGIEVMLDPLGMGSLSGIMIDIDGNPIPNFDLFVRSESTHASRIQVTSDSHGNFEIENIPVGRIRFETNSLPRFIMAGIHLTEGEHKELDLILDRGNYSLAGQVMDEEGNSLGGAVITISWVYRENGLLYESLRKTISNHNGRFQITGLGGGTYTVIATAAGFKGILQKQNIGEDFGSSDSYVAILLQTLEEKPSEV